MPPSQITTITNKKFSLKWQAPHYEEFLPPTAEPPPGDSSSHFIAQCVSNKSSSVFEVDSSQSLKEKALMTYGDASCFNVYPLGVFVYPESGVYFNYSSYISNATYVMCTTTPDYHWVSATRLSADLSSPMLP
jgi:hypothetical protein